MNNQDDFTATVRRLFCSEQWTRLMGGEAQISRVGPRGALARWPELGVSVACYALPEPGAYRLYAWGGARSVEMPEVDEESILGNTGTLIEALWPAEVAA